MKYRLYNRVSTADQNLDRQLKKTSQYAKNRLDAEPKQVATYRDKSTGTDTDRSGYQQLLNDVEEGDIVIVASVSRIARSIRDLSDTIDRLEDAGASLHIVDEGLQFEPEESDPYQTAMLQLLGVFAELEAEINRERIRDGIQTRQQSNDYHHGRPPLGFESEDGQLYPAENHDRVVETLKLIQEGELSKRQGAKELETSRATINRALERKDLYGL